MGNNSDPSSNFSRTGNPAADAISNRDGGKYSEKDASTETGSPSKDVAKAWHRARDDAGVVSIADEFLDGLMRTLVKTLREEPDYLVAHMNGDVLDRLAGRRHAI